MKQDKCKTKQNKTENNQTKKPQYPYTYAYHFQPTENQSKILREVGGIRHFTYRRTKVRIILLRNYTNEKKVD